MQMFLRPVFASPPLLASLPLFNFVIFCFVSWSYSSASPLFNFVISSLRFCFRLFLIILLFLVIMIIIIKIIMVIDLIFTIIIIMIKISNKINPITIIITELCVQLIKEQVVIAFSFDRLTQEISPHNNCPFFSNPYQYHHHPHCIYFINCSVWIFKVSLL